MDSGSFRPILDAAALALAGDADWLSARNEEYRRRRDAVIGGLRRAGLEVETPAAAIYVWARLPAAVSDLEYADALLAETGVTVTPGTVFGPTGAGYVRISLGTPIERIVTAMARWQAWAQRAPV